MTLRQKMKKLHLINRFYFNYNKDKGVRERADHCRYYVFHPTRENLL